MLVVTRKVGEQIRIGDDVTIMVTQLAGGAVRIGIEAPRGVNIVRGELLAPHDEQLPSPCHESR